jgi:hypothetical protein
MMGKAGRASSWEAAPWRLTGCLACRDPSAVEKGTTMKKGKSQAKKPALDKPKATSVTAPKRKQAKMAHRPKAQ